MLSTTERGGETGIFRHHWQKLVSVRKVVGPNGERPSICYEGL